MITEILPINNASLKKAADIINSGNLIGMPTETVYGLAGLGTDINAVKRIFEVKGRPTDNPLIAHVHKDYDISKLAVIRYAYVYELIKRYTPGPLTLVLESKGVVVKEAICNGETLAIRIPAHSGCQEFLRLVDAPIVAPSANISKHTSPVTATHVYNDLNGKIPLILDGGKCSGGIESTVLDVTGEVPRILRPGLITKEMIEEVTGCCEVVTDNADVKLRSPGTKYAHYMPKCETAMYGKNELQKAKDRYEKELALNRSPFIMCEDSVSGFFEGLNVLNLGKNGLEIASNLYDKLLEGELKADIIIAISPERNDGVFLGISNRLNKSCKRYE